MTLTLDLSLQYGLCVLKFLNLGTVALLSALEHGG